MSEPPPAADQGCATGMLKALGLMILMIALLVGVVVLGFYYALTTGHL